MASEYMIFFPLVPLALFLAWGCWKQRKNPLLSVALICGGLVFVAITSGAAAIVIGAFAAMIWLAGRFF